MMYFCQGGQYMKQPSKERWNIRIFNIRSLRQWHGSGLSQTGCADVAGIRVSTLRNFENSETLPSSIEALLALAIVLETPVERLINPSYLSALKDAIEHRRR